jgi:hypothetical protein
MCHPGPLDFDDWADCQAERAGSDDFPSLPGRRAMYWLFTDFNQVDFDSGILIDVDFRFVEVWRPPFRTNLAMIT